MFEVQMSELHTAIEQLRNHVNKLTDDFKQVRNDPNAFKRVKQAFAESLAKSWSELGLNVTDIKSLETLKDLQEQTENFLEQLHRVILRPRRTRLEKQLDAWLTAWHKTKMPWDRFLEEADDEQLDELEDLLEQVGTPELENDIVKDVWVEWVKYQVKRIKNEEKHYTNLKVWLKRFDDNLDGALALDGFWQSIEKQLDDDKICNTIERKWIDDRLATLSQLKEDVQNENLGLLKKYESYENEWEELRDVLLSLKMLLQESSEHDLSLVKKIIEGWSRIDFKNMQDLIGTLEEITRFKRRLQETPQWTEARESLSDSSLKCVKQLVESKPQKVKLKENSTIEDYRNNLATFDDALSTWLEEFEDAVEQFRKELVKWKKEVPSGIELDEQLDDLESRLLQNSDSLETIVEIHNSFITIREEIRHFLKQELTEKQREMWNFLSKQKASGQDQFSLKELSETLPTTEQLEILKELDQKNFINIIVTIK